LASVIHKPPSPSSTSDSCTDSGARGREDSFTELYDRYAPQVERWVRRLAGPRFDAEDLLHDVFLVVWRRHHEFRDEAKITTWLFRITAQVVRWRRRNDTLRSWLLGQHGHALAEATQRGPTPVEDYERREESLRLYAALDRLPEKYRTVLVLFALEDSAGEQIAALLGIDINTVWVRLHRARVKLADLLGVERRSP
jgi:RNA polymerase sigma-70 factor (ECF subfamily)